MICSQRILECSAPQKFVELLKSWKQHKEFNKKQIALMEAGVTVTDAEILSKDNQLQKFVQSWRKHHNGPLENDGELDELVHRFADDDKKLRSALTREIRYMKYSMTNIKFDNPLFKQQGVDTSVILSSIRLLLMKTEVPMAAR